MRLVLTHFREHLFRHPYDLIKSLLIKVKYIQYDVIQYILSH